VIHVNFIPCINVLFWLRIGTIGLTYLLHPTLFALENKKENFSPLTWAKNLPNPTHFPFVEKAISYNVDSLEGNGKQTYGSYSPTALSIQQVKYSF